MELAEYMEDAFTAGEREQFRVDTREKAEWALRKLKRVRDKMREDEALAAAEIEKIKAWLAGEKERLQRDEDYFVGLLGSYHLRLLDEDPRAKTVRLPHGALKMRAQAPEYERDNDRLLAWLDERGMVDLVKVKREPDWAGLKPRLTATETGVVVMTDTGEVVQGLRVSFRPPKFTVETD